MTQSVIEIALALALTGFAAWDAARRGRSWYGWSRFVFFTSFIGLIVWLVVRRRAPVAAERLSLWRTALLMLTGVPLLACTVLAAIVTTTYLFQFARIEGQAMAPTLKDQQHVIVNKLVYQLEEPQVGDVVMHYYPIDPKKAFVKRIVGVAGDVLRSDAGHVFRNDVPMSDDFVPEAFRSHDTWGPRTVPKGYYFVMGDHRNNSSDSRSWDYVPKRYVIGRIIP